MSLIKLYHNLHVRLDKTSIRRLQCIKSAKGYKSYADTIRDLIDMYYSNIIEKKRNNKGDKA